MKRKVLLAALVIVAFGLTACNAGNNAAPQPPPSEAEGSVHLTPPLPDKLPVVTDEASVEPVMRDLIALAATHAKGMPDEARNPMIIVTDGFACGVKVKAMSCPPFDEGSSLAITINPAVAWDQYRQPVGHGGGNISVQDSVLASYVQYILYFYVQKHEPRLLSTQLGDDTNTERLAQLATCMRGAVYAGLESAMDPALAATWLPTENDPFADAFGKGTQGKC